jgi:hypothetical protein
VGSPFLVVQHPFRKSGRAWRDLVFREQADRPGDRGMSDFSVREMAYIKCYVKTEDRILAYQQAFGGYDGRVSRKAASARARNRVRTCASPNVR